MTNEQIATLLSIAIPTDITSFIINDVYEDDHQMCADVTINGVNVEFLWHDNVGFIEYWYESPKAMKALVGAIKSAVYMALDERGHGSADEAQRAAWREEIEAYFH